MSIGALISISRKINRNTNENVAIVVFHITRFREIIIFTYILILVLASFGLFFLHIRM